MGRSHACNHTNVIPFTSHVGGERTRKVRETTTNGRLKPAEHGHRRELRERGGGGGGGGGERGRGGGERRRVGRRGGELRDEGCVSPDIYSLNIIRR
jgi:hypothetical protein